MGRMAIGADRGLQVSRHDGMTMGAIFVVCVDPGVATSTGLGDVHLIGWAGWIGVAENVVRAVAALAIRGHQQSFFAEREAMDGVDVIGIDAGESVLLRHSAGAVAGAAGLRDVERIDGGAGVGLGENAMSVAVTAGAGMLFRRSVNASYEPGGLLRVAGITGHGRDVVGMRITLDVCVASIAPEAAVNARRKLVAIDSDAVACIVLHGFVAMAGEAVGLGMERGRQRKEGEKHNACCRDSLPGSPLFCCPGFANGSGGSLPAGSEMVRIY